MILRIKSSIFLLAFVSLLVLIYTQDSSYTYSYYIKSPTNSSYFASSISFSSQTSSTPLLALSSASGDVFVYSLSAKHNASALVSNPNYYFGTSNPVPLPPVTIITPPASLRTPFAFTAVAISTTRLAIVYSFSSSSGVVGSTGAFVVYTHNNGPPFSTNAILAGQDVFTTANDTFASFGGGYAHAVGISSPWLLIGSPLADGGVGRLYIYRETNQWTLNSIIYGSDPRLNSTKLTANSVAISQTNAYPIGVVGLPYANFGSGAIMLISFSDSSYTYTIQPPLSPSLELFGWSVAISDSGSHIVVGTPGSNVAYVYRTITSLGVYREGQGLIGGPSTPVQLQLIAALLPPATESSSFGASVAINNFGDVAVGDLSGNVFRYQFDPDTTVTVTLSAPSQTFRNSLSSNGNSSIATTASSSVSSTPSASSTVSGSISPSPSTATSASASSLQTPTRSRSLTSSISISVSASVSVSTTTSATPTLGPVSPTPSPAFNLAGGDYGVSLAIGSGGVIQYDNGQVDVIRTLAVGSPEDSLDLPNNFLSYPYLTPNQTTSHKRATPNGPSGSLLLYVDCDDIVVSTFGNYLTANGVRYGCVLQSSGIDVVIDGDLDIPFNTTVTIPSDLVVLLQGSLRLLSNSSVLNISGDSAIIVRGAVQWNSGSLYVVLGPNWGDSPAVQPVYYSSSDGNTTAVNGSYGTPNVVAVWATNNFLYTKCQPTSQATGAGTGLLVNVGENGDCDPGFVGSSFGRNDYIINAFVGVFLPLLVIGGLTLLIWGLVRGYKYLKHRFFPKKKDEKPLVSHDDDPEHGEGKSGEENNETVREATGTGRGGSGSGEGKSTK